MARADQGFHLDVDAALSKRRRSRTLAARSAAVRRHLAAFAQSRTSKMTPRVLFFKRLACVAFLAGRWMLRGLIAIPSKDDASASRQLETPRRRTNAVAAGPPFRFQIDPSFSDANRRPRPRPAKAWRQRHAEIISSSLVATIDTSMGSRGHAKSRHTKPSPGEGHCQDLSRPSALVDRLPTFFTSRSPATARHHAERYLTTFHPPPTIP